MGTHLGDHEYSRPIVGDHEYSLAEEIWSPGKPCTNIAITMVLNVPTRAALNSNRHIELPSLFNCGFVHDFCW